MKESVKPRQRSKEKKGGEEEQEGEEEGSGGRQQACRVGAETKAGETVSTKRGEDGTGQTAKSEESESETEGTNCSQPVLDDSLEAKAMNFLESVNPNDSESADALLSNLASISSDSSTDFVQSIVVLISSPDWAITATSMKMLKTLLQNCSPKIHLALVKADLIARLMITLHPQSLSLAEADDIHINVMKIVDWSIWLATPYGLAALEIEDENEQQAVFETVLKQVVAPCEKYIWHLCVNRFLMIDGPKSMHFFALLGQFLQICPFYQPTMDFVHHMPIPLTISSCLTFCRNDESIWYFLEDMNKAQLEREEEGREERHMWKKVHRMLITEGIEDVIEERLQNVENGFTDIIAESIKWNNLLGVNLPEQE
ncbi:hypothetical protein BLNAU_20949 [Blattamonas nauphoetae]|uniref:Uncharacterized protein n=1 Tax=Blattamonas nauphoetae TaxID=2049346 RepID=A0ABQ9WX73_9EUKA|nr:hypothetical protein BLNAU_20949 [Blattamonas nauphoetae]